MGTSKTPLVVLNKVFKAAPKAAGDLYVTAKNGHLSVSDGIVENQIIFASEVDSKISNIPKLDLSGYATIATIDSLQTQLSELKKVPVSVPAAPLTVSAATISGSSSDVIINGLTIGKGTSSVATNTAVGVNALKLNTPQGVDNTAIGFEALTKNLGGQGAFTSCQGNTAVGSKALHECGGSVLGNGMWNSAVGLKALERLTTGTSNTALGFCAGTAVTTECGNTFVGAQANANTGNPINPITITNATAIGAGAIATASNQVILGNNKVTSYKTGNGADILRKVSVPFASNSPGTVGDIAYDTTYMYVCITENTWRRASLEAW